MTFIKRLPTFEHGFCPITKMTAKLATTCRFALVDILLKDTYYCPIEIIKGLTDKGQFQYLTKLKGPREGTYLYTTQFLALR